jgi:hypothetical protein
MNPDRFTMTSATRTENAANQKRLRARPIHGLAEPGIGFEPMTFSLQERCSTS